MLTVAKRKNYHYLALVQQTGSRLSQLPQSPAAPGWGVAQKHHIDPPRCRVLFPSTPSYGAAWLSMVRRGSVGSASACCKAGPSSIPGSAPQGSFPHWAHKRWGYGERLQRMATDECIVIEWMYVCYKIKISKKSGIMPPNLKSKLFFYNIWQFFKAIFLDKIHEVLHLQLSPIWKTMYEKLS